MSIQSVEQSIGNLDARVTNLEATVSDGNKKLDTIIATMAEAKGGWRMLLLIGGAVAGFVAIVLGAVETLRGAFGK